MDGTCTRLRARELKAHFFDFLNSWTPGQPVSKAALEGALGAKMDNCQRDDTVVNERGDIRNGGDTCAVTFTVRNKKGLLVLPAGRVDGHIVSDSRGKKATFSMTGVQPMLELPKPYSKYNGAIANIAAPNGVAGIDIRLPTHCIRIFGQ